MRFSNILTMLWLVLFGSVASAQNDVCSITNLAAEVVSCENGTFSVQLTFEHQNTSNLGFQVLGGTGINPVLGVFGYADVPVTIGPIVAVPGVPFTLTVQDLGNLTCQDDVTIGPLNCTGSCEITNLQVQPFDCNTQDSTFKLSINFQAFHAGNDFFDVYGPTNDFLGSFALADLPITINDYPWNVGTSTSAVRICIQDNPDCCVLKQFVLPPDCSSPPSNDSCSINDLTVQTGDCTSDSTYEVTINFTGVTSVISPVFAVYANGSFFGEFPLTALPLTIDNFPYNGGKNDVVKICLNPNAGSIGAVGCCETRSFKVPGCLPGSGGTPLPCRIRAIAATAGDCNSDSTYRLTLKFTVRNPDNDTVVVYAANGDTVGVFALDSMPIVIDSFPWNGGAYDSVTVCVSDNCCRVRRFGAPGCLPGLSCEINDIYTKVLDCTSNNTYGLIVGFKVSGATGESFTITTAGGDVVGTWPLDSLPITISDYPWGGHALDTFTICLNSNDTSAAPCCKSRRVQAPDCLQSPCTIYDLFAKSGDCNDDGTYDLTIRFKVSNPDGDEFTVYTGDGNTALGTFTLDDLPLTIENFPNSIGKRDSVMVCFGTGCCLMKRFKAPDCGPPSNNCNISDVVLDPGACDTLTGTYSLVVNFNATGPDSTAQFEVTLNNGTSLGIFPLSLLPLTIPGVPGIPGTPVIHGQICIVGQPNCCESFEFQAPSCGGGGNNGNCEIVDLVVDSVGLCNPDGTFDIEVNFHFGASTQADSFTVEGNGVVFGQFALSALPLVIQNFPGVNGSTPEVTVCAVGFPNCCETVEFQAPDCTPNLDSCNIYDLQVLATPCINGQFFAILNFEFENTGANGFTISGNGTSYGSFTYDVTQPIILGPLDGGTSGPGSGTNYEFTVTDALNPNCSDFYQLGFVDCDNFVSPDERGAATLQGKLGFMPNPAVDRLTAVTLLRDGTSAGEGQVLLFRNDGRLVRTLTVAESSAFNLDVADLVPGMYRVVVQSASGHSEGTFVKM